MTLSKQESLILRAIAITGIFLHNYCHWLPWAVKENEYTFNPDNPANLLIRLNFLNADLIIHLFSFFGHYGVPVFLFLSGYGLVMKYECAATSRISFGAFAKYNYLKLLRLMLPAFVLFVAYWIWRHGSEGLHFYSPAKIVGHLTMTINLWEHPSTVIKPGPYWYFGLTLQLYLLFHIAFYRRSTRRLLLAVALCLILQLLCLALQKANPANVEILKWYRYNFMGSVLPFALGMLLARYGGKGDKLNEQTSIRPLLKHRAVLLAIAIVSFMLVFAMSLNSIAWTFAPLFVCTGMVALVKSMPCNTASRALKPLTFLGTISAAIFVIHPLMRDIFLPISKANHTFTGLLLYIAATISAAVIYHKLSNRRKKTN